MKDLKAGKAAASRYARGYQARAGRRAQRRRISSGTQQRVHRHRRALRSPGLRERKLAGAVADWHGASRRGRQRFGYRGPARISATVREPARRSGTRCAVYRLCRRGDRTARFIALGESSDAADRERGRDDQHGYDRARQRFQALHRRHGDGFNVRADVEEDHGAITISRSTFPRTGSARAITHRLPRNRFRFCSSSPGSTATITSRATRGTKSAVLRRRR